MRSIYYSELEIFISPTPLCKFKNSIYFKDSYFMYVYQDLYQITGIPEHKRLKGIKD